MSNIQEAIKLLKELEWGQVPGTRRTCRWCGRYEVDGHGSYCEFSMALVLLEAEPDEPPKTCYHIADEIVVLVNMLTDKISNQAGEFLRNQAEIERVKAENKAKDKAISLLNSMVESGESHTETSRAVLNQARGGDK